MIHISVPGKGEFDLKCLLLDLNGTLALDGTLLPGVHERLAQLAPRLEIFLVTCDTHGNGAQIADGLKIGIRRTSRPGSEEAMEKASIARDLGAESAVAIGNGDADTLMLKECVIGIAVLGREGLSCKALLNADVLIGSICDGLDLLLNEKRLIATLRGSA